MAGDRVSLSALQKAVVGNLMQVTVISNYAVEGRGESVEPLRAEVSAVPVPSELPNSESELIALSGTLVSLPVASGAEHSAFNLSTVGNPTGTSLQLRVPVEVDPIVRTSFQVPPRSRRPARPSVSPGPRTSV
ncbi:MAG: hypothetical protein JXB05_05795 [Myxococcaceae bacterium]|nr:hypothetical protein [Myxococcaceae bacterium]